MKLSQLVLAAVMVTLPAFALAQDSSSTPPAASSSTATSPAPAAPAAPALPISMPTTATGAPDVQAAVNMLDTDIMFLVNDIKANTRFKVEGVEAIQGFDWKNGQWLTGVGLPFLNIGSYDYISMELARQTTTGGGVRSKAIPLLSNKIRLNALTSPVVKWGLSRIPILNNNPDLVNKLSNALSVGVATGHDFNSDVNQKVIFNRAVVDMSFTYKFGGASAPAVPQ
jgi:hypothetical protein